jgi:hypothetical protein
MIESRFDQETKLTTHVCSGRVSPAEIEAQIQEFFAGRPTLHTAWDFSDADISELSKEAVSQIADFVKATIHSREGGKTALIFPTEMLMSMEGQLESISEIELAQVQIKIFNTMDRALAWLKG